MQSKSITLLKKNKLVYGVGVNDADYVVQKFERIGYEAGRIKLNLVWVCPYYSIWMAMLKRCYSAKYQESRPTYTGCTVATEWLTFSNFKSWMEKQDWQNKHLDKDLLFEGNKVYSSDTCVFVTQLVNQFINDGGAIRGNRLIGVCWDKKMDKFRAQCGNPFTKKRESLGRFSSEQEAHNAWRKRKHELACQLADMQTDQRVADALRARYNQRNTAPSRD